MTASVIVEHGEETQRYRDTDLPLTVGSDADAHIRLPAGLAPPALAFLGMLDGRPYAQPATRDAALRLNGAPLEGSAWLADGDVLSGGILSLRCKIEPAQIVFRVQPPAEAFTLPPLAVPSAPAGGATGRIEPSEYHAPAPARAMQRRAIRPVAVIAWLAFLMLCLLAWFLFTAKTVVLQIEPAPDEVMVQGRLPGVAIAGRYLLHPGDYTLVAKRIGYRRLVNEITVHTGPDPQRIPLTMEKLPGLLGISTAPVEGASVSIDGTDAGNTPLHAIELAPGPHQILIRAEHYRAYRTGLEIEGGGIRQELAAELIPDWAPVSIASEPAGAVLWVDGREEGPTPLTVRLDAGRRLLELTLAGYKDWRSEIEVIADEPLALPTVQMEEADARLSLLSEPAGASVSVDGAYRGITPVELPLRPGVAHEIQLSMAGHETVTRKVRLRPDEADRLEMSLPARTGVIRLAVQPPGTSLYVDGQPRDAAAGELRLTAVAHTLEIRKEGYESWRTTITPRPGYPKVLSVNLKTGTSVPQEAPGTTLRTGQGQTLRLIPPGEFMMGSSRREQGRRSNETLHAVELIRPAYIGTREITNAEFREFQSGHNSGAVHRYTLDGDTQPAVEVSWEEAAAFCNWLSARDSLPPAYVAKGETLVPASPMSTGYRLPTEAEWVRAARYAGTGDGLKYPWGDAYPPVSGTGNYADASAAKILSDVMDSYDDGFPATAPTGSFAANALGLFDLGGNVAEWVHDYYTIYPSAGGGRLTDPAGPAEGRYHVIRGAGWMDAGISRLRLSYRDYGDDRRQDVGFRIARYAQ